MKKLLDVIKKRNIDVLAVVVILMIGVTMFISMHAGDELWDFANCYKMFNGYKIYKDLNVIITPLFFYISQIFFKIFGANFLAFRIYNIVISTVFIMLIYYIFHDCLKITRRRAIFYSVIIIAIFCGMIAAGANYNMLAVIPILIAMILMLKKKENFLVLGLLLCITFMTKQNVFVFFALGIFVYKFVTKDTIKNKVVSLFKIYIVSLIGILIFLIYLYLDNNLFNFINYCFLGLTEFGSNNIVFSFSGGQYLYIAIVAIIAIFFVIRNEKTNKVLDKDVINNLKILLSIGTPLLLISYPIINYYHATLASVVILIAFIYTIDNILIKNLEIERKLEKKVCYILIIVLISYFYNGLVINIIGIEKKEYVFNNQGIYYGTVMQKEDLKNIESVCTYIEEQEKKGRDVKILSYKANLYMVPLNKNNSIFDLAFLGNLGVAGEEGLIRQIKDLEHTLILLERDSEDIFWQESKLARKYIIDNCEKVGEIEEYDIYYIK